MYKSISTNSDDTYFVIDFFCGTGGFITEAYDSAFIIRIKLLQAASSTIE
jgi:hypothetical protein